MSSEYGKLNAVITFDAGFNMWGLKLPFSGEHQLCWYTSKNVEYERGRKQYEKFLELLKSEGAKVYEISHIMEKIIENSSLAEKANIIKEVWASKKRRPSPSNLTALHVTRGFPDSLLHKNGRIITPDFIRANIYARDIGFGTPEGLVISKMRSYSRREQPKLVRLAMKHSELLSERIRILWDADRDQTMKDLDGAIEGGDVQIISRDTVACGIGQQTNMLGFVNLATRLLNAKNSGVTRVIGVKLPKSPASIYMHLDTTFCFYDKGGAIVMPYVFESNLVKGMPKRELLLKLLDALRRDLQRDSRNVDSTPTAHTFADVGECVILEKFGSEIRRRRVRSFIDFLIQEELLFEDQIVLVGGKPSGENDVGHLVTALKEQYTQAPNVVCLKPRVLLAYERNVNTNTALVERGVKLKSIPDTYLDMGGGPHCLTLPLDRKGGSD